MDSIITTLAKTDKVCVCAVLSPFHNQNAKWEFSPGGSISDILIRIGLPPKIPARILVNDLLILDEHRDAIRPLAGDLVAIRALPQVAAAAALLIAVAAAGASSAATTAAVGAGLVTAGTIGSAIVSAAAGGVVSLLGKLALNALIPPPSAPKPSISSFPASFSISGGSNQASPYSPIPQLYGTRLVAPALCANWYTEVDTFNQFLIGVLTCGIGPVDMRQLKIANTPIEQFEDVKWEVRQGYPDDAPLTLYPQDVIEQQINVLLLDTANKNTIGTGWQTQTSAVNGNAISIDISFPQGLLTINNVGNRRELWVQYQIRYAPHGTSSWTYLNLNGQPVSSSYIIQAGSASQQLLRNTVKWTVPQGQYDVEVQVVGITWLPNRSLDDTFFGQTFWTAIRTFRNSDPIIQPGLSKIALRIRASNQLSGTISQLQCIAGSILPDYDPVAKVWGSLPGSWDCPYYKTGSPKFGMSNSVTHLGTGSSLYITEGASDGGRVASRAIPVIGWAQHQVQIAGYVKATASTSITIWAIYGIDDQFQLPSWPNWAANTQYNVGDIVSPATGPNNEGPLPGWGGYTYQCIRAGTSGAAMPAFNQSISGITKDGADPGLRWQNIGGPTIHDGVVFNGTVGISWQTITATVVIPYPQPLPFGGSQVYYPGDVVTYVLNQYVCRLYCQGIVPTNSTYFTLLPVGTQFDANYMRLMMSGGPNATVYFDDFTMLRDGINVLPNGSFDAPGAITSNPATHYRDVLEGPANQRPVTDSRVDLPALQSWWQYAQTNQYFHNAIYDKVSTVFMTLTKIAAAGRASFRQNNDLYSVVLDQPQVTPVQFFSPRNSYNFKSTKEFPDLPQAIRVRFANALKNYQVEEIIAYDDGYSAATPNLKYEMLDESEVVAVICDDLAGVETIATQPWKDARYHLAVGRLRRKFIR